MNKARVLLVDDQKEFVDLMKERLELAGYKVTGCYDPDQALENIQAAEYDVAIVDLILGEADGITIMHRLKIISPLIECIVLSGQGTLKIAVEAMKQGAYDFLEKPCDQEKVIEVIDGACKIKREHEKRIFNAAKKVNAIFEKAMVGATFAQAGDMNTAENLVKKK